MGTGHEEQEGQHGKLREAGMGLDGVKTKKSHRGLPVSHRTAFLVPL
jgi:hypothetical protein